MSSRFDAVSAVRVFHVAKRVLNELVVNFQLRPQKRIDDDNHDADDDDDDDGIDDKTAVYFKSPS